MHDGAEITLDNLRSYFNANKWTFARTMAWMPHWYIVRPNYVKGKARYERAETAEESVFVAAVLFIRAHGELRPWGKAAPRHYLDLDGYSYWSMGDPIETTWIINRKKIDPA